MKSMQPIIIGCFALWIKENITKLLFFKIDYSIIKKMIDSNDKLKEYERVFENIFRYKKYTLSDKEEALLSKISKMLGNNYETYSRTNARN